MSERDGRSRIDDEDMAATGLSRIFRRARRSRCLHRVEYLGGVCHDNSVLVCQILLDLVREPYPLRALWVDDERLGIGDLALVSAQHEGLEIAPDLTALATEVRPHPMW